MSENSGVPIDLQIYKNTHHKSKEYIEDRKKREALLRIGKELETPPPRVLEDPEALKKWKEVCGIFKDFQFVTDVDTTFVEKYCLAYSEYCQLQETRKEILSKELDNLQTFHAMDKIHLHYQINKKLEILIKFEDRMFLNPASRIRNIPQKAEEKPITDPLDKFGLINV